MSSLGPGSQITDMAGDGHACEVCGGRGWVLGGYSGECRLGCSRCAGDGWVRVSGDGTGNGRLQTLLAEIAAELKGHCDAQ